MHRVFRFLWTVAVVASGCRGGGDERPIEIELVEKGDTVEISAPVNLIAGGERLAQTFRMESEYFPTDVSALPGDSFAVLDRADATVRVYDPNGHLLREFGQLGKGPGEFEGPYALEALGRHLAIWDRNGRLTVVSVDGRVTGIHTFEWGDSPAIWQRLPLTRWEEPFQLSREDVTRRLQGLDDRSFGLQLQTRDERFDTELLNADANESVKRYDHYVVRLDTTASVIDTVLSLVGPQLVIGQRPSDITYAMGQERPFALRPGWTAGRGWRAWGSALEPRFNVQFDDGSSLLIRWPRDDRPFDRSDFDNYVTWEIEAYARTKGERWKAQAERINRDAWVDEVMAYQGSAERPQFSSVFGAGDCMAIGGFRPSDGPHGDSYALLILNVRSPDQWHVVELPPGPTFVRDFTDTGLWTLTIEESGVRTIQRFEMPSGLCVAEASDEAG